MTRAHGRKEARPATVARTRRRREAAVPDYAAQLATLVDEPPEGDEWLHEQKLDGYRIGARVDGGRVQLLSRRGQEWTAEFPSVVAAVARLGTHELLLDGEVAVVAPNGVTSFQSLQRRGVRTPVTYFVFDLLHLDGEDLAHLPLEERKRRLRALLDAGGKGNGKGRVLRYSDHVVGRGLEPVGEDPWSEYWQVTQRLPGGGR